MTLVVYNASHVDDEGIRWIAALPQLKSLIVTGARVSNAAMRFLGENRHLERLALSLEKSPIDDGGLASLHGAKELRFLTLSGTKATEAGARALISALPQCSVGLNGRMVTPERGG